MTSAFFTLSMCEIFQAFTMRSLKQSLFTLKTRNMMLWLTVAITLPLTLSVIYVPALAEVFSLTPLGPLELAVSLGLAISIIPLIEGVKTIQRAMWRG